MDIKQLYNNNLQKIPNEYGDVSIMFNQTSLQWVQSYLLNRKHCISEKDINTSMQTGRCSSIGSEFAWHASGPVRSPRPAHSFVATWS